MKLIALLTMFFLQIGTAQKNEEKITKIICLFKRFTKTDVYNAPKPLKLSKALFQDCKMQVRIVSNIEVVGINDLVLFINNQNDKECL